MSKFPGFPAEGQYWQFPTIINGYVNILSGNEFKVLWYILRHTYGYQKESDIISISQIMNGIKKKDGTVVDKGTGIRYRQTIVRAIKRLVDLGFIKRTAGGEGGKANTFSPCIINISPLHEHTPSPLHDATPPPLAPTYSTINTNTIDNYNNSDTSKEGRVSKCPNKDEGHKGCVEFISSVALSRNCKFPNFGKQVNAVHKMLRAGYNFNQINKQIDRMEADRFWINRGFDLMTVANEIGKGGNYGNKG